MKKALLLLLFGSFPGLSLAQSQLSVSDVNAISGEKVVVPITISAGDGIAALQFRLEFDDQFLTIEHDDAILPGDQLLDHSFGFSRQPGRLSVALLSGSLSSLRAGEGSVLQVVFRVAAGLEEGSSTQITLSGVEASDGLGDGVNVSVQSGRLTIDAGGNAPLGSQNELIFPHLANGVFGGGRFFVTLIVVNRTEAPVEGRVSFLGSDGAPLAVRLTDGRSGSDLPFKAAPRGSLFMRTDGLGVLVAGYARISSTGPIGGVLLFTAVEEDGGILTEAGVTNSPTGERFSVPVIFQPQVIETGLALANVNSEPVDVGLSLRDGEGLEIATESIVLAPGEQLPRFASQFFEVLTTQPNFRGSIEISATLPISVIALEQQEILLTTFPVIGVR